MNAISALFILLSVLFGNPTEKTFMIDGPSMSPTINNGDRVMVNTELNDRIGKDDIIIFEQDDKSFCKRVIGIEGDHIETVGTQIKVNGKERYHSEVQIGKDADITLQKDEFYVIGDNLENSLDSRTYGPIKRSQIIGKVTSVMKLTNTNRIEEIRP